MREKNHSTLGRWQKTQYESKLYIVKLWKYIRAMKTTLALSSQCAQLKVLYLYGYVTNNLSVMQRLQICSSSPPSIYEHEKKMIFLRKCVLFVCLMLFGCGFGTIDPSQPTLLQHPIATEHKRSNGRTSTIQNS